LRKNFKLERKQVEESLVNKKYDEILATYLLLSCSPSKTFKSEQDGQVKQKVIKISFNHSI